jgi:hypothetical protein
MTKARTAISKSPPLDSEAVTRRHKTAQWVPTPAQAVAIEALALGKHDAEAAEAAKVARETVNRWRHSPYFAAALDQRRKEAWQLTHDRTRGIAGRALDVLEDALKDSTTAMAAAAQVLKLVKLEVTAPTGETDPEVRMRREASAWAEAELRRRGEWLQDDLDQMLATFGPARAENERRLAELTNKRLATLRRQAAEDVEE